MTMKVILAIYFLVSVSGLQNCFQSSCKPKATFLKSHQFGETTPESSKLVNPLVFAPAIALTITPEISNAADSLSTALVAYGHYSLIILLTACLTAERALIKPNMTQEEESLVGVIDLSK